MWDLPGPGLEPVSPALAGGFLTTAPPLSGAPLCHLDSILGHQFVACPRQPKGHLTLVKNIPVEHSL